MAELPYAAEGLQEALGYTYNDISLLKKALTHSSYSNEMRLRHVDAECNERLEFLGDSVLSIVVSEYLFSHYTKRPEGELTRMRAEVVCEKALSKFAVKIGLGNYLLLGHGEDKNNGRERTRNVSSRADILVNSSTAVSFRLSTRNSAQQRSDSANSLIFSFIPSIL